MITATEVADKELEWVMAIGIIIIMAVGTGMVGMVGGFAVLFLPMGFLSLHCRLVIQRLSSAAILIITATTLIFNKYPQEAFLW